MDLIKDKIILVTGGTGTVGRKLIATLLDKYSPKIIRVYSRDETKQFFLEKHLMKYRDNLRFFLGDIRDKERLNRALKGVDIVFHLAALKHVGACEYNPFEAIKTNILGLQNLIELSIDHNIEYLIFTSTDKAATPSNTMGVTKLLGEKLVTSANYYKGKSKTKFYSVRFGNVLGSRGSIIPLIEEQVKNSLSITLTHKEMTRYIMTIERAIDLIIKTMKYAQGGEVFVLKMDAVKVIDLIEVLVEFYADLYNKIVDHIEIKEIGIFAGEKLYEELFSIEESQRTYEINDLFIIFPQLSELKIDKSLYPNLSVFDVTKPFNSKDGPFLSKSEIKEILIKNNII